MMLVFSTMTSVAAPDNDSEKSKIFIYVVHIPPQGQDCIELKYKSGELINPCQIDEHWKIKVHEKEMTVMQLQQLLVVEAYLDWDAPKSPSNRIVQIRADNSAPWRLISRVIEACGMALIWKIEYGTEAIQVYLPKDGDFQPAEEVRMVVAYNHSAPLTPVMRIGVKEFKDWEGFYAYLKALAPALKAEKIPLKLCPDSSVPFQIILETIKLIKKCDDSIKIEFSTSPPPETKILKRKRSGKDREEAIITGLIWLAKHQNPDGSWSARSFQNQCQGAKCSGTGDEQFNIGLTGLSLLSFTNAGYTYKSRDTFADICFGDVVRKAAVYLTEIQISDGSFGGVKDGKFIYNQAIATLAIADLYDLPMDKPDGISLK
ncbi:MAG: hypothetical protein AB1599_04470, partial [Planctomycetota bacterium]